MNVGSTVIISIFYMRKHHLEILCDFFSPLVKHVVGDRAGNGHLELELLNIVLQCHVENGNFLTFIDL